MTKYSAPSIEVVNFNSSDAPRIGMQWWAEVQTGVNYIAIGNDAPSSDPAIFTLRCDAVDKSPFFTEPVQNWVCRGVTVPGAYVYVDPNDPNHPGASWFVEDGKSC